jgi:hypothetical protein
MYPCTPRRKKRRKTKRLSLAELNAMTLVVGLLLVNHFSTTFVRVCLFYQFKRVATSSGFADALEREAICQKGTESCSERYRVASQPDADLFQGFQLSTGNR